MELLTRAAPLSTDPSAPLDDPAVLRAAQSHFRQRFEQGVQPVEILTEFRLLRQEVGRALRENLADSAPVSDVIAAELIVHDALDGAIALALDGLTRLLGEARDDFLATTAHEVRQPITSIKASVQIARRLLNRPQPELSEALEELARADTATDQMGTMLDRLSSAARLALGQYEIDRGEVDLSEIVLAVLAQIDSDAAARVQFSAEGDPTGQWDGAALGQVIANLVSNAVKYSAPPAPITIEIDGSADVVHMIVRDPGIGFAIEDLPQLFRRYGRGAEAATSPADGLGLGLYLAQGIVVGHGGRIWAESPGRGQGAAFHVVLPRGAV